MSYEDIDRELLKGQHPGFKGNREDLARLAAAAQTPTRTLEREEAVRCWNQYNTTRKDWAVTASGVTVKTALRYADLQGTNLARANLFDADLRGTV